MISRETETLDVAPVDLLSGMSKEFVKDLKPSFPSQFQGEDGLDIDFFWVNETGGPAKLTGGISVQPTVSLRGGGFVCQAC
jgi:hypothetical protein